MARSPRSLVSAVQRAAREHRLTDLFALALEAHPGFANQLLGHSGLPPVEYVETEAEVRTRHGRPVDLEVVGFDAQGGRLCRLWSENKAGARYQPDQLNDYASDLPAVPERRQLITVVDDLLEVPEDHLSPGAPRWRAFTWRDVAVMAWQAGRAAAPPETRPQWRDAAMDRSAPASERILAELLTYLEEEHGVVFEPMGHVHVAAFAYAAETGEILEAMLTRAAELIDADAVKDVIWSGDGDKLWQLFQSEGTWAAPAGGYPELQASSVDPWSRDRIGEPAFGAGYTLPAKKLRDWLFSGEMRGWRDAIEAQGFSVADDDGWLRVWRTKYFAELIPVGVTHEAQARALADFADSALSFLAQHPPAVSPPTA
jgi:hypothetical protein